MYLRIAVSTDAQAIHDLHTQSVKELCNCYTEEQKDGWLASRTPEGYLPAIDRGEMYVYARDHRILGFAHVVPGEIVALFVAPDVARTGIGTSLLRHAFERARSEGNGTVGLDATLNAIGFYEAFGFVKTGAHNIRRGSAELAVMKMEMRGKLTGS